MRNITKFIIYLTLLLAPRAAFAVDTSDSCECPKLSCNTACELEQDLTFYTEKCAGGTRVRSCSRPTCVKLENAPASCGVTAGPATPAAPVAAVTKTTNADRDIASVEEEREAVGLVKFLEGQAHRLGVDKKKTPLNVGDEVRERDRIETESSGRVQIEFYSGNILNVTPGSEIVISEAGDSIQSADKKRMVLDLIKGRVRTKVNKKYEGNEQSHYRIRTGAAVAGVRGTEFAIAYFEEGDNMVSKVETLEGRVELSDRSMKTKTEISRGEGGAFTVSKEVLRAQIDKPDAEVKGVLSPVYRMTAEQLASVERETLFAALAGSRGRGGRQAKADDICSNPAGPINHCAWSCENNPSGEKRCRTDLPKVSCVRRICNANGDWSQPTRLPASFHEACVHNKTVVKPCDY
jgi:hypothetical protein